MFHQEPIQFQQIAFTQSDLSKQERVVVQIFIFLGLICISAGIFLLIPAHTPEYVLLSLSPVLAGFAVNFVRALKVRA
ncbi:MAG: hypothetical protein H7175_08130 [Burkholderiales bacterium]|nr:hypothetical protein [Anaerolineae bacterium]